MAKKKKTRQRPLIERPSARLDLEELRSLIAMFKESGVEEFELRAPKLRLRVALGSGTPSPGLEYEYPAPTRAYLPPRPVSPPPLSAPSPTPPEAAPEQPGEQPEEAPASNLLEIASPIVGTFYRAPAPDAPNYVEVGTRVTEEKVLCIVEAMKIMNEIKAEARGVMAEILVENGQPVEFGQPLFRIAPE